MMELSIVECMACGKAIEHNSDVFMTTLFQVVHPIFKLQAPLVLCEICKKFPIDELQVMILQRLDV